MAIDAIRAWVRLDQAFTNFNRDLERRFEVTGAQLAILRILAEMEPVTLIQLRSRLSMHPATLGQLIDRLVAKGLARRRPGRDDRRVREVTPSPAGRRLLERAPVAGPVRLRSAPIEANRAKAMADAFNDAIEAFGLEEYAR
jgi:DNA-binding MarR family transcriptional regulator